MLSFTLSTFQVEKYEIAENSEHNELIANKKEKMKLTSIDPEDIWSVLTEAHHNIRDERPSEGLLVGAWAHIMLENAHGRKVWNNNVGNVGNLPSDLQKKYYSHFGKAKYRSFNSIVSGAEAYWNMLYRCPMAVKYLEMRMPEMAALSLKRCNYYRSNEENYSRVLTTLYARGSKISKSRKGPE